MCVTYRKLKEDLDEARDQVMDGVGNLRTVAADAERVSSMAKNVHIILEPAVQPRPSGLVPPNPGDKVVFVCRDCGHRFLAKIPLLPLPVKCPECGSRRTEQDTMVRY